VSKSGSGTKPNYDDDDAPELTADWFASADLHQGEKLVRRGRPPLATKKTLVSLRLSPHVIEYFKGMGPGWQTRIDETLKRSVPTKPIHQSDTRGKAARTAVAKRARTTPLAKKMGPDPASKKH
jgi:uncharacterized protein (DUF4415 family)